MKEFLAKHVGDQKFAVDASAVKNDSWKSWNRPIAVLV